MKATRVTINNLFAGYARAGMDPQSWCENLTKEQQLAAQLDFIEARASLLMGLPHDSAYGVPANVQGLSKRLFDQIRKARDAMNQSQMIHACTFMLEAGVAMQRISTHLVVAEAVDVTERLQRPRSSGGQETARLKKAAAEDNQVKAAEHWRKLESEGRPERERVAIIARRMGHPSDTVRRWIKKAGLR